MSPLTVLSINAYAMGHAAYQQGLERGFSVHVPEMRFHSVRLAEVNRGDLLGRVAHRALTLRLPGVGQRDHDWIRLRRELAGSLFLRRRLQRLLPSTRPDVLHLHTQSITLLAHDFMRAIPTVVSLDSTAAILARVHPVPAARTYRPIIRLERRCFAAAAHVVCWSEFARRSVVEDYGVGPERVSVIRPAVAHERFPERMVEHKAGRMRLLFVGNDFVRKGGADLIAVYGEQLHASCELDVVSNGIDRLPDIDGLRLHRGLTANSDELMRLYGQADVFVMPSYEEAFGLVYLEAMAASLPCIGSRSLAVPELIADGHRGLTVRAGDRQQLAAAITQLRDDPLMRIKLGAMARKFARRECDAATNCRRLAALFESCRGVEIARMRRAMVRGAACN